MIARHVSRAKAVRLVTGGRLIGCGFAAAAAALGFGTQRAGLAPLLLVVLWLAFGVILFIDARRRVRPRTPPWILIVDLVAVAALMTMTGGIASIYFPLIMIPPFEAHVLYGRRAILASVLGGLGTFALALFATHEATDPRLMVMRLGIVVLIGAAVLRRSDYEQRIHEDMENLANWTHAGALDREATVRETLTRAARALRAPRVAMAWSSPGAPMHFAQLHSSHFELEDESFDSLVAPQLESASAFLQPRNGSGLRAVDDAISDFDGPFLAPSVAEHLAAECVIGARLATQTVRGWLFFLDQRRPDADDLMLAQVVARLASADLDQLSLSEMVRETAASNERMSLSRDLHDGLLQSLSGLALHAQVARRAVATDPRAAEEHLGTVVEELVAGQHALRDFVDELRPEIATARREPARDRLERIAHAIAQQWRVAIDLDASGIGQLEPRITNEVASLVAEALANAAKHSGATRIRGTVRQENGSVAIDVVDDGRGFPFQGRLELAQLLAEQRGPWSLKERIVALGGDLAIESSGGGSRVEVRVPLAIL